MKNEYNKFINSKKDKPLIAGFDVDESALNPYLFDFQRYIVAKALKHGRYAIFADTGLGKTLMQLSWADAVTRKTGKPVLSNLPCLEPN